jgi:hypothetical protein
VLICFFLRLYFLFKTSGARNNQAHFSFRDKALQCAWSLVFSEIKL